MKNLTDVMDMTIAVRGKESVIVFAANGDEGCPYDGCYDYHQIFAVRPDQDPVRIRSLPAAMAGVSPSADALPIALPDGLHVLTQGHAAAAATGPYDAAPDTFFLVRGEAVHHKWEKWFSGAYASAPSGDHALVLGVGIESAAFRTGNPGPSSVRMIVVSSSSLKSEVLVKGAENGPSYASPAVAADGTNAAVAFLQKTSDAKATVLLAGWVNPITGKLDGALQQIAKGDLGAPAIALEGTRVHLVWAERAGSAPYRLKQSTWDRAAPKADAAVALATKTDSSFAPSLSFAAGHALLAWTSGSQNTAGQAHFGASPIAPTNDMLERAASAATPLSAATTNGRDPEMAIEDGKGLIAWTEVDKAGRRIAVAPLTCTP